MKNKLFYFVLICVVLALLTDRCNTKPKIVTKTIIKIDTITTVIDNTKPTKIETVYLTQKDTVWKTTVLKDTIIKIIYKNKKVNQYTYIDTLKNGILTSTILTDTIYKRKINLKTFNKTITTNTKETVLASQFFVGPTFVFDDTKQVQETSLNAYYTYRGKFLIMGGLGYNNKIKSTIYNVGFAVKF